MRGFSDVRKVRVPRRCIAEAHGHLQRVGRTGNEGMVLWVGRGSGAAFEVTGSLIPRQVGISTGHGVCVTVDEDELHRINVWMYQQGLQIIAQLHSHPTEAYHSETDDSYPIATTEGCLSLVIPDFAARPFALDACAVYRLEQGSWRELSSTETAALIQVEE